MIIFPILEFVFIPFLIVFFECFMCHGFFTNTPNSAHVLKYFGKYLGSVKEVGFFWINPFYTPSYISLKRNTLIDLV